MNWMPKEIAFLKSNVNRLSIKEMANKLNRSKNSIYSELSKIQISHQPYNKQYMAIKSRKYCVNHNFFHNINSEEKAYFLGLLFADGYNSEKRGTVSLGLEKNDKNILKTFRKVIKSTYKIYTYKKSRFKKDRKHTTMCLLYIRSSPMSKDLAKWGCGQQKTKHIRVPSINKNLIRHFIRGYFDGDGSIIFSKKIYQGYVCSVVRSSITSVSGKAYEL